MVDFERLTYYLDEVDFDDHEGLEQSAEDRGHGKVLEEPQQRRHHLFGVWGLGSNEFWRLYNSVDISTRPRHGSGTWEVLEEPKQRRHHLFGVWGPCLST